MERQKYNYFINQLVLVFLFFFLFSAKADANDINIPFCVIDNSGVNRVKSPVQGGVPLPEGVLMPEFVSELGVFDSKGNELVSQFDPFVLWWGKDRSVKWLLVDLFADIEANSRQLFWIRKKKSASKSSIKIREGKNEIEVITGPLKALINKKKGTILDSVFIDIDGDNTFTLDEQIISPSLTNGGLITSEKQGIVYGQTNNYNIWGTESGRIKEYKPDRCLQSHEYGSGYGPPDKVVVEAKGPVRTSIRIEGRHWPKINERDGSLQKFYYYTVWLHFYTGKSYIKIEHSLENNRLDFPIPIYGIKEFKLSFSLNNQNRDSVSYVLGGEYKNISGNLMNQSVSLLQDSANLNLWDLHDKLKGKTEEEQKKVPGYFFQAGWKIGPASFRGYKIQKYSSKGNASLILSKGEHAPGWGGVFSNESGISFYINNFWEECPKGIDLKKDSLDLLLFPGFSPENFQIHSSTRKSHAITLDFHGEAPASQSLSNRAKEYQYPLVLKTDIEWLAKSKAWPRLVGLFPEQNCTMTHWYPHFKWSKKIITARWKTNGLYSGFNQGGMHENYWSLFNGFLQEGCLNSWEKGVVMAKWASESIPWLLKDYMLSPDNTEPQNQLIAYGPKEVYTSSKSASIKGWTDPYISNVISFSSPSKFHMDGEHLIHMWPFEWYYLTGSPLAKDGLIAIGNMAKYSVHRNFFTRKPSNGGMLNPALSLDKIFYYDDKKYPERKPSYFYTRIFSSHLLSSAWSYAATGDPNSLFYAKWLIRRILYLQRENGGILCERKRWKSIPPWQESEVAIAAYELYRETGDEELLDIMGSWLEWAIDEAYVPGIGMPHRFERGKDRLKYEHHWYPGVAAPACYIALGDNRALEMTKEWAGSSMANVKKETLVNHPVGQTAGFVLSILEKEKKDKVPPKPINDLRGRFIKGTGIELKWTSPVDLGKESSGLAHRYWLKYSDAPIVDHPKYPEEIGKKIGFYHADNISDEPKPKKSGSTVTFVIKKFVPHGVYGSNKIFNYKDLKGNTYYFALKAWDKAGNLSSLSNVVKIRLTQ